MSSNHGLSEKALLGKRLTGEFIGEKFFDEILKNMVSAR
jgi:hypothetical protein